MIVSIPATKLIEGFVPHVLTELAQRTHTNSDNPSRAFLSIAVAYEPSISTDRHTDQVKGSSADWTVSDSSNLTTLRSSAVLRKRYTRLRMATARHLVIQHDRETSVLTARLFDVADGCFKNFLKGLCNNGSQYITSALPPSQAPRREAISVRSNDCGRLTTIPRRPFSGTR